jgi:hypothetical protein
MGPTVQSQRATWLPLLAVLGSVITSAILAGPARQGNENDGDVGAIVHQNYFPELTVGDQREFSFAMTVGNDTERGKLVLKIEEGKEIRGQKYLKQLAQVEGISGISADPEVAYLRYADDGFYVIEDTGGNLPEHREMPRPLRLGQEWSYRSASGTSSCKVEGYEDVKLGNHVLKGCVKVSDAMISENGNKTVTTTWYQRNVGEVKITIDDGNSLIVATQINPAPK